MKTLERTMEIWRKYKDRFVELGPDAERELNEVFAYTINVLEGQHKANEALAQAALNRDDETRPLV